MGKRAQKLLCQGAQVELLGGSCRRLRRAMRPGSLRSHEPTAAFNAGQHSAEEAGSRRWRREEWHMRQETEQRVAMWNARGIQEPTRRQELERWQQRRGGAGDETKANATAQDRFWTDACLTPGMDPTLRRGKGPDEAKSIGGQVCQRHKWCEGRSELGARASCGRSPAPSRPTLSMGEPLGLAPILSMC